MPTEVCDSEQNTLFTARPQDKELQRNRDKTKCSLYWADCLSCVGLGSVGTSQHLGTHERCPLDASCSCSPLWFGLLVPTTYPMILITPQGVRWGLRGDWDQKSWSVEEKRSRRHSSNISPHPQTKYFSRGNITESESYVFLSWTIWIQTHHVANGDSESRSGSYSAWEAPHWCTTPSHRFTVTSQMSSWDRPGFWKSQSRNVGWRERCHNLSSHFLPQVF